MESVCVREERVKRGAGPQEPPAVPGAVPAAPADVPATGTALCAAAMALGIIAVVVPFAELLLSVPAVVLACIALRRAGRQPGPYGGRGMAVAGLVLGLIGLAMCVPSVIILAQIL
jgi:hypothetical protein